MRPLAAALTTSALGHRGVSTWNAKAAVPSNLQSAGSVRVRPKDAERIGLQHQLLLSGQGCSCCSDCILMQSRSSAVQTKSLHLVWLPDIPVSLHSARSLPIRVSMCSWSVVSLLQSIRRARNGKTACAGRGAAQRHKSTAASTGQQLCTVPGICAAAGSKQ